MTEGSGIGYASSSPETKSAGIDFGKFFRGIGMRLLSGASLMLRGTLGSAAQVKNVITPTEKCRQIECGDVRFDHPGTCVGKMANILQFPCRTIVYYGNVIIFDERFGHVGDNAASTASDNGHVIFHFVER